MSSAKSSSKSSGGVSLRTIAPLIFLMAVCTLSFPILFTGVVSLFQGPAQEFVVTGSPIQLTNTADRSMNSNFAYNYPTIVGRVEQTGYRVVFPESFTQMMTQMMTSPGGICKITVEGRNAGSGVISASKVISTQNCQ